MADDTETPDLLSEPLTNEEAEALRGIRTAMRLAHRTAWNAGWYRDPKTGEAKHRNFGEVIALMHSELSEALEADRKSLKDDKLPHRSGVEVELADHFIRIADTTISRGENVPAAIIHIGRLLTVYSLTELRFAMTLMLGFTLAAEHELDLAGAIIEKDRYNRAREDHTLAARAGEHGKKY